MYKQSTPLNWVTSGSSHFDPIKRNKYTLVDASVSGQLTRLTGVRLSGVYCITIS